MQFVNQHGHFWKNNFKTMKITKLPIAKTDLKIIFSPIQLTLQRECVCRCLLADLQHKLSKIPIVTSSKVLITITINIEGNKGMKIISHAYWMHYFVISTCRMQISVHLIFSFFSWFHNHHLLPISTFCHSMRQFSMKC